MYTETSAGYLSHDGKTTVHYTVYTPNCTPRAVFQICHGMNEHIERYRDFAAFLCEHGIVVCGNDHLGHGKTSESENWGFFADENGPEHLVEDIDALNRIMKKRYPSLPYILFGHSMGSFITRKYIAIYREHIDAVIISGTSGGEASLRLGKLLAAVICRLKGSHYRSQLLDRLVNGKFTERFKTEGKYAWLTRDTKIQQLYAADPACTFLFTAGAYYDLFSMLCEVTDSAWYASVPKDLPILLMSGDADPVGGYGEGVRKVQRLLADAEISSLECRLYPGARHELLNEINRAEVYADVLRFAESIVSIVILARTGGNVQ